MHTVTRSYYPVDGGTRYKRRKKKKATRGVYEPSQSAGGDSELCGCYHRSEF